MVLQFLLIILVIFLIMLLLFYSLLEVVQICKLISYLPTMYV
jgi:hypothetical protein